MRTTDVTLVFLPNQQFFNDISNDPIAWHFIVNNLVPRVSHLPAQAREERGSLLSRLGGKMRDPGNEVALSTACCNKLFLSEGKKLQLTACRFSQRYSTFVHGIE